MLKKIILKLIKKSVLDSEFHSREGLDRIFVNIENEEISLSRNVIRSNIGVAVD